MRLANKILHMQLMKNMNIMRTSNCNGQYLRLIVKSFKQYIYKVLLSKKFWLNPVVTTSYAQFLWIFKANLMLIFYIIILLKLWIGICDNQIRWWYNDTSKLKKKFLRNYWLKNMKTNSHITWINDRTIYIFKDSNIT